MVEPRELVTICRQIGGMMEAGVDILRITRVLRAQTDNPHLLGAFEEIERALRLGDSLSEALERVPDVFSPFAVSLVREGEARRDIPGAFLRIADFMQQEEEAAPIFDHHKPAPAAPPQVNVAFLGDRSPVTVGVVRELLEGVQTAVLRALTIGAGLLLSLASVWWGVEEGYIEHRWQNVTLCCVAALFMAGAGVWLRRRRDADRKKLQGCALCGAQATPELSLSRLPTVHGAMISDHCAATIALTSGPLNTEREVQTYVSTPEGPASMPPAPGTALAAPQSAGAAHEWAAARAAAQAGANPPSEVWSHDLGEARKEARKRYGPMAEATDTFGLEPDIYEVGGANRVSGSNGAKGPNGRGRNAASNQSEPSSAPRPTRDEADFD